MSSAPAGREYLFILLMEGFDWVDESLQRSLKAAGLPPVSRTESMLMAKVQRGMNRPAELARSLRLTRQAVHQAVASMARRGLFELRPDDSDGRIRTVHLTARGAEMRRQAQWFVRRSTEVLEERIGATQVEALYRAFLCDWGEPVTVVLPPVQD